MTSRSISITDLIRWHQKPRIKRQSGTWICAGKGVTACGVSPQSAYSTWQILMRPKIQYQNQDRGSMWLVQK